MILCQVAVFVGKQNSHKKCIANVSVCCHILFLLLAFIEISSISLLAFIIAMASSNVLLKSYVKINGLYEYFPNLLESSLLPRFFYY